MLAKKQLSQDERKLYYPLNNWLSHRNEGKAKDTAVLFNLVTVSYLKESGMVV